MFDRQVRFSYGPPARVVDGLDRLTELTERQYLSQIAVERDDDSADSAPVLSQRSTASRSAVGRLTHPAVGPPGHVQEVPLPAPAIGCGTLNVMKAK